MADTNNGGPAFPTYEEVDHMDDAKGHYVTKVYPVEGMSLRDYFAAKAMQSLILRGTFDGDRDTLAEAAHEHADAMLKAREGK